MSKPETQQGAARFRASAAWLSLWAEARHWALILPGVFGEPAELTTVGLPRRLALQCSNWLWSIEGLVRRLLIAAALSFDLAALAPLRDRRHGTQPRAGAVRSNAPRFRLFASASGNRARRPRNVAQSTAPYGHVPFPADDLLRLGAPRGMQGPALPAGSGNVSPSASPASSGQPRRLNPLHRRGRISRWDPDYRGVEDKPAGYRRPGGARPSRKRERRRVERISSIHRLPTSTEWRRVDEEWERVIPAPALAARIATLLRVIERPGRWVAGLARRLSRSNLSARFAALPLPVLRRPKLDASPPPPLHEQMMAGHRLMRLDSS